MRVIGIVLLFLVFFPISSAIYEKRIYDGWIMGGSQITIDNQTYKVNYIRENNITIIYFPEGISIVIYPWEDKCGKEWIYSVCQTSQKFERAGFPVRTDLHGIINTSVYLYINTSEVDLAINKTLNANDLFAGDIIDVKTVLEKRGFLDITNISYSDRFSENFDIFSLSGCQVASNIVT